MCKRLTLKTPYFGFHMTVDDSAPSINFCILGDQKIALEFGKAGTSSDITIHDKKARDAVRTWVVANGFPEKIPPLFQTILMSEYVIFYVDSLDKFTGEQIIALDILGKKDGILCHAYEVDSTRLHMMLKGTVVENYKHVEIPNLADEVNAMPPVSDADAGEQLEVVIDHSFDVKGVGTVILGKVTRGSIKQYDTLVHYPTLSEVLVKSIQMHDDPVNVASYPARVGLALKGVKPDDIQRGDILSLAQNDSLVVSSHVRLEYVPNNFYKGGLSENQGCIVSIGLQARASIISQITTSSSSGDDDDTSNIATIDLKFAKPIAYHIGDTAVLLRPEATPVRIVGSGCIIQSV